MISSLWARRQSCAALSLILLGVATAGTTSAQSPLLYVPNRTSSTVQVFSINSSSGALGALGSQPAANQASVIAVTPNNKFMYVGANPVIYPFVVASNGSLTAVQAPLPTVGGVSGLAIDPTGKFLFASAGDTIFTLSIDQTTGALTVGTSVSLGGGTAPHGLTVDGGGHLYAAMTGSGAVGQFSINSSTGALTPIGTGFAASDGGTERVAIGLTNVRYQSVGEHRHGIYDRGHGCAHHQRNHAVRIGARLAHGAYGGRQLPDRDRPGRRILPRCSASGAVAFSRKSALQSRPARRRSA